MARTGLHLRAAFFALLFALPIFACAQTAFRSAAPVPVPSPRPSPPPSPPMNGVAHIAVRVKDIAASVAFYQKLGFVQAFAMHKGDVVTQSFLKVNDKQYIELYPVTAQDPQVGFLHLCFEGADLNALHDFYVAEGLTPIAVRKAGAGNLLFTMKGPQQYAQPQNIEYTQYMPGSMHTNDIGQHLGPDRVADKMVVVVLAMQDPAAARAFYLGKLGFKPDARFKGALDLPGSSGEMVQIVPVATLGARSSIVLSTPDIKRSAQELKTHGIASQGHDGLLVTDPDGNQIRIVAQRSLSPGKPK